VGELRLVSLELVEGAACGRFLVRGILEFDDGEREAIDEHDDVRASVDLLLGDGELIDSEPVVRVRIREVHNPNLVVDDAISLPIFDRDAVHQVAVKDAIVLKQGRRFRSENAPDGLFPSLGRDAGVDLRDRLAQPVHEHDVGVARAFLRGTTEGDVRAEQDGIADFPEPLQGGLFDFGFCEHKRCHVRLKLSALFCEWLNLLSFSSYKYPRWDFASER